jgi:hypothetical protein
MGVSSAMIGPNNKCSLNSQGLCLNCRCFSSTAAQAFVGEIASSFPVGLQSKDVAGPIANILETKAWPPSLMGCSK